jgi:hypothetical protein
MSNEVRLWTVYSYPKDFPNIPYMARLWVSDEKGARATDQKIFGDLGHLRSVFNKMGLARLPRMPNDEPHVVEVWI